MRASDLCIVGAGPVGLALALRCATRGLSVSLVDGGDSASGPIGRLCSVRGTLPRRITPGFGAAERFCGSASQGCASKRS
ncbi:FAD-dependent oxidoreductase [Sinorhizobium sp. M4_45]|uniref:FAD-dependent oxidoreductase n=1 Tax=Sinorhizobium sp. M4_45 TaxID=2037901 RepID=UPI0011AF8272|nr:FAD-dependent oxidoreductase [Sinorhizobium sp. M4_45]